MFYYAVNAAVLPFITLSISPFSVLWHRDGAAGNLLMKSNVYKLFTR